MFDLLPPELQIKILGNVSARDIASVSQINNQFKKISYEEFLWILLTLKDFNVKLTVTEKFSPRNFYQRVLFPYRKTIGVWQRQNLQDYSSLLRVSVRDECLLYEELIPPPRIQDPIQRVEFLRVRCGRDDPAAVIVNLNKLAVSDVVRIVAPAGLDTDLKVIMPNIRDHTTNPVEWRQIMQDFLSLMFGQVPLNDLLLMRFMKTYHSRALYAYRRLQMNWTNSSQPIKPGLYMGTYGAHGVEMISVTSPGSMKGTTGRKVTGDPNVPFNELTFRVIEEECLDVPLEAQRDMQELSEFLENPQYIRYQEGQKLDFVVPADCLEREAVGFNTCKGRWNCECQVAHHGFSDPSFIRGNLVVFDDNMFAVIFLALSSVSLYRRITDEL